MSGRKFSKSVSDWKIAFSTAIAQLNDLHQRGYRIVVFSNQLVAKDQVDVRVKFLKSKAEQISKAVWLTCLAVG